ncbi:hypothetical protein FQN50_004718 [Emmonsiellopsis sp. PD_5]|nr:hypothetical protein FQN50_004718 [Emmonsiellopsis sp. PD_5]
MAPEQRTLRKALITRASRSALNLFRAFTKDATKLRETPPAKMGQPSTSTAETAKADSPDQHPDTYHNCEHPNFAHYPLDGPLLATVWPITHDGRIQQLQRIQASGQLCPAQSRNVDAAIAWHRQYPANEHCPDDRKFFQFGRLLDSEKDVDMYWYCPYVFCTAPWSICTFNLDINPKRLYPSRSRYSCAKINSNVLVFL